MTKTAQIIRDEAGNPAFAVLPYGDYERLVNAAEDAADLRDFDSYRAASSETFPDEVAARLIEGESPVAVFREYRGLSRRQLAEASGIASAYLAQIENGDRTGTVDVLKRIASALDVSLDLIA